MWRKPILLMLAAAFSLQLHAGVLGYSSASGSVQGVVPNRGPGQPYQCVYGGSTFGNCSMFNSTTLQGWNSLGQSWDGLSASFLGDAISEVTPGALHVAAHAQLDNYPYDPPNVVSKGWGSDDQVAQARAMWADQLTNTSGQTIKIQFDWAIDGSMQVSGIARGAVHLDGDWGDEWMRSALPVKPLEGSVGTIDLGAAPFYYSFTASPVITLAPGESRYTWFRITAIANTCYWCQGASTPTHLSAGSITTDFSHTAALQSVAVTDIFGNPIVGPTFDSYSGFDYLGLGGGGSPVPEPATWMLLGAGLIAVGIRRRARAAGRSR
jgi:hypothetical protein